MTPDERIANYTCILAVVASLQFVALIIQAFVMGIQSKRLKETVKATEKAANAIPTIERAYVFVNMNGVVSSPNGNNISGEFKHSFTVPINLINQGKTPAVLKKMYAGIKITRDKITIAQAEETIKEIPFNSMPDVDSGIREIRGEKRWSNHIQIDVGESDIREFLNDSIWNANPSRLYCCGKVIYNDVMKNSHTTWFCWELRGKDGIINRITPIIFFRADNDELNEYT